MPIEQAYADLDGPAFAAYYCVGCIFRFERCFQSIQALQLDSSQYKPYSLGGEEITMESRIEVEGEIKEIEPRSPVVIVNDYQPGDDGYVEPLPPTVAEAVQASPSSEFSGYVGLWRKES